MGQTKGPSADGSQNQNEKFIVPMSQDPAKAAAEAAAQAALEAALLAASQANTQTQSEILQYNNPDNKGELRINSRASKRTIRRNTEDPFLWLKSPGTLTWGIAAKWAFEDNAKARKQKLKNNEVQRIRCAHYDQDSLIYFWVTSPQDPDGYEVNLVDGKYVANIADWTFEEGIAPAPGISQKFDLLPAPELMLGLPALCIDLNKARKTTYFEPSKKSDAGEASTKGTGKLKKETPGTSAPEVKDPGTEDENE